MPSKQGGYGYLALMICVAILALVAGGSVQAGAALGRRLAETELLYIGGEFRRAFASFAAATPEGASPYPRTLQDLLRDPRFPGTRRHLRRLYVDPMSGQADWGLIASPEGGIAGVHSQSDREPVKQQGFSDGDEDFANRKSYRQWLFMSRPNGPAGRGGASSR